MRQLRTRLGASVRSAIETHLSLLEGLSGDLPEDPVLDGKVAFLAAPKTAAAKQASRSSGARLTGGGPGHESPPALEAGRSARRMPIYEYPCEKCGHEFEREQRITEDPVKTCPTCRAKKVRRLISRTAFVLKGGGWYSDLYSSSKPGGAGDEEASRPTPQASAASEPKRATPKRSPRATRRARRPKPRARARASREDRLTRARRHDAPLYCATPSEGRTDMTGSATPHRRRRRHGARPDAPRAARRGDRGTRRRAEHRPPCLAVVLVGDNPASALVHQGQAPRVRTRRA